MDHSKNNLLVNLPTKSDIEKNNINNTAGSSSSGSSNGDFDGGYFPSGK